MVVGACHLELRIADSRSLKDRRRVVSRIKNRLRSRFNASVVEIAPDDSWTRASLGLAVVAEVRPEAEQKLHEILDHVEWIQPGVIDDAVIEYY